MKVPFSYLDKKFEGVLEPGHEVYEELNILMKTGDFTLGKAVDEFEKNVANLVGAKHALGIANGTDALRISLRLAGVGPGDQVITSANTFVASAGCIDELFASPRFIDNGPGHVMDAALLEKAITKRTKAIIPVHFTGNPCDMDEIMHVANKHGIPVIEDACQALMAEYKGRMCGTIGLAGAISLHPLKVLNGTGDGGVILTNDSDFYEKAKRYRNHGLVGRNNISEFGCNSRLDSIQAIFLNHLIKETPRCLEARRANAAYYDKQLDDVIGVFTTPRRDYANSCYHLYFIEVHEKIRDHLVNHLNNLDIEAKVHYPVPLQGVLGFLGYSRNDFPQAFKQSDRIVTLPVHECLTKEQLDFVVDSIKGFMNGL